MRLTSLEKRPRRDASAASRNGLRVTRWAVVAAMVLTGCGSPSSKESTSQERARTPLSEYPRCDDQRQEIADHGKAVEKASESLYIHELNEISISAAEDKVRVIRTPTVVPDWVSCIGVSVFWSSASADGAGSPLSGTLNLTGFEDAGSTSRRLDFRAFAPVPMEVPLQPGAWKPVPDRTEVWQDVLASEAPSGETTDGVRIAWVANGAYFELEGPFSLETALSVADSTTTRGP